MRMRFIVFLYLTLFCNFFAAHGNDFCDCIPQAATTTLPTPPPPQGPPEPPPSLEQPLEKPLVPPVPEKTVEQIKALPATPTCCSHADKCKLEQDCYTINFEDVPVLQFIRFISEISSINFIFDNNDLEEIKITIVSKEPTPVRDLLATLIQILRMHGLSVVEQGNNVLIYGISKTGKVELGKVGAVITDENTSAACESTVITRVFRLYNLSPAKVEAVIKPLLSTNAVINSLEETRHLIISDLTANIDKIAELLIALDTPNAALDIGEYQVKQADNPTVIVAYARDILASLSQGSALQLIPQVSSNKIFIVGSPYLIGKALQVLQSLDTAEISEVANLPATAIANNSFYVYKLKYRDGRMIANAIQQIGANLQYSGIGNPDLISAIYSIQWIEVNNTIVISGTQDAIDKVVQLMDDLDTSPGQVYIEVLIIDTSIANSLSFGVEWVALANEQSKLAFASGLTGGPSDPFLQGARNALNSPPPNAARGGGSGTGDVPLAPGFGFGIIGNIIRHNGHSFLTLGALINALSTESDTTIVLNPRIMTQDTREANFFVGQNIPYQTTNTVIRDTGSVTQNIQYEDIGVQLRVTPQIGPNRIVTLDIDQAVSDVTSPTAVISTVGGTSSILAPSTNKTLTTTRVHVPDGCFLVMSGHIRDSRAFNKSGIPCLGSLPWIGSAFSTTSDARTKRNLIMFIQPHVVTNNQEGIDLTNQEGYEFNWESHPASIRECGPRRAPECEMYPPPKCPKRS